MNEDVANFRQKSEHEHNERPSRAGIPEADAGVQRPKPAGNLPGKLRFFRTMLWVLIYALLVLFFFALILLGGFRLQTQIIGGALLACVALVIATYVLQWRD